MLLNCCLVSILLLIFWSEIVTAFGRHGKPHKPCKKYDSKMPSFDMYNLRVSERKCKEYMWKMDEREQIKKHECKRAFFVIRGQRTKPSEYPHMGALGWMSTNDTWVFLCGSSLISERFVLTSAHCTKVKHTSVRNPHPQIVRLGVTNIYESNFEIPVDAKIKNIIRHPGYKSPRKYYDIALLELEKAVTFTKFVHPACLWSRPVIDTKKEITVTGWGATDKHNRFSHNLLYAKIDIFNTTSCDYISTLHNRNWWGTTHQMCAGKMDGSVDTCYGDSGGPIQYKIFNTTKEGSMHMVVGITTFGSTKCAQKNTPTVYTKVSSFIQWIENHVWPEKRNMPLARIMFPNQ